MPEETIAVNTTTAGTSNTTSNGQAQATPPAVANTTETPAEQTVPYARFKEVNDALKVIQEENAKQAKARQAEDEKKLADQAKWQELADQRQARIAELEPQHAALTERTTVLEEILSGIVEKEVKEWPAEVKEFDPGKEADVVARYKWLEKGRALAAKLAAAPATPGNSRGPKIAGAAGSSAAQEQQKAWSQRAAQRYR